MTRSMAPPLRREEAAAKAEHTCGVGELIFLPLDPVLQRFSLATRLLNAGLHRFR